MDGLTVDDNKFEQNNCKHHENKKSTKKKIIVRLNQSINEESDDLINLAKKLEMPNLATILEQFKNKLKTRRLVSSISQKKVLELEEKASNSKFKPLRSLTSYWLFYDIDSTDSKKIISSLRAIPEVDSANFVATTFLPSPNYVDLQNYLKPETSPIPSLGGINANWARSQTLIGSGVNFIDIEEGWNVNHEEFTSNVPTLIHGVNRNGFLYVRHGTKVLGVVASRDDGDPPAPTGGVTGIAPGVDSIKICSLWDGIDPAENSLVGSDLDRLPNAMITAMDNSSVGDVILIEAMTRPPPDGDPIGYMPVEYYDYIFDVIRLAVALGRIVIEPAGDGSSFLDSIPTENDTAGFANLNRDSGAIMVGAANFTPLQRAADGLLATNWGTRVNCFALGSDIATTSAEGETAPLGTPTGLNDIYSENFGLTSGSSAIIAGAAIVVQGAMKVALGAPLTSSEMRQILSDPNNGLDSGLLEIGVMPDLEKILTVLRPAIYIRDHVGDTGDVPSTGSISSSPDIMVSTDNALTEADFGESNRNSILSSNVTPGVDNYIYIRLQNRGGNIGNVKVRLYWSPVSTFVDPTMWNKIEDTIEISVSNDGFLHTILPPLTWPAADIPAAGHYCFIAIVMPPHEYGNGPVIPPVTNFDINRFYDYIRNNNKVTWRNFNVIAPPPPPPPPGPEPGGSGSGAGKSSISMDFLIRGSPDKTRKFDLEICRRLPRDAKLWLELPSHLERRITKKYFWKRIHTKHHTIQIAIPPLFTVRLKDVYLGKATNYRCKFHLEYSKGLEKNGHSIHIRQLYNNNEMGRVTWELRSEGKRLKDDQIKQ